MTTDATGEGGGVVGPLPIILTDDPLPADAGPVRAAFERAGLDAGGVTDELIEALRDQTAAATPMMRDDPVLAYQVVADPATAARRLGLPTIPSVTVAPSVDRPIQASYWPASADAEVDELLGRLFARVASDPAFAGAWSTDPVATLLTNAAGSPSSVLAAAIRQLLQGAGRPTSGEPSLTELLNASGSEAAAPDDGDDDRTAGR